MAAFDFPSSPSVNQTYTANGVTWKWNGTMWMRVSGAGYLEKIEEGNSKVEVDDSGSGNVTITTDGTERVRVTSAGNFGIGDASPARPLSVSSNQISARFTSSSADSQIEVIDSSGTVVYGSASGNAIVQAGGAERLRITSGGDVSIGGLASPRAKLDIEDAGTSKDVILRVSADDNNPYALVVANDTFNTTSNRGFAFWVGADKVHHIEARTSTTNSENEIMISAGDAITFRTNVSQERLRITAGGNIWHPTGGNLFLGSTNLGDFTSAGIDNFNRIGIRAGSATAGTTPDPNNCAIKIYPANVRTATTGTLSGGIAWQHLDPSHSTWDSSYGDGAQIWMGAALHDVPGQERDRFNLWMNSGTTGNSQPGNLAIEAYPNGMVRHPKVPAFMVRNSTAANAFAANARATWDISILNNGSHFDMTNDVFTAPIDGIYTFNCMMLSNANTRLFHNFRVNNTIIDGTRSEGHAVSGSYMTCTITMTYTLSANDYVDVYVRNNNAYGGVYTNFNGYLVG